MASRLAVSLLGAVLCVSACSASTSSRTRSSDAPTATPTPTASTPTASFRPVVLVPAVLGAYERQVLSDGAIAVWPLTAANDAGSAGLGPRGRTATLLGLVPHPTRGPVLSGVPRLALTFRASSRLITPLKTGLGTGDAWTVELWVRADGCSHENERLGGMSFRDKRGRQGLDMFHYPSTAVARCRLGAEFWHNNAFLGGCATHDPPIAGRWQHFAVTYSKHFLRCWLDGEIVGTGVVRHGVDIPTTPFGIAGSGNGFSAALATASLSAMAVYPFALTRDVLRGHAQLGP